MANGLFTLKQQVYATEVGAWPNQKTLAVDYLVVAGGGAGSGGYGAGGGAGGMLSGNIPVVTNSAITVTIGAGGAAVAGTVGNPGANSSFGNILANGGGFGTGGWGGRAGSGGSGGGSGGNTTSRQWGEAVAGQGNRGGGAMSETGPSLGGGGGAGTAGGMGYGGNAAGFGGNGLGTYIGGPLTVYGGGGGSSVYNNTAANVNGLGGTGGGGAGGAPGSNNGTSGTANTGGGGGGASVQPGNTTTGGAGGSGIVIISYPDAYQAPTATTGSPTVSTTGTGSLFFGGSSQYLTYSANSFNTAGSWTIESWCYFTSSGNNDVVVNGLASDRLGVVFVGTTLFVGDGITNNINVANAKLLNQWFHLAVVKNGGTYTAYINGVSVGSSTTALTATTLTTWQVGGRPSVNAYTIGHLSNLRITTSAVYTANFTVPTAPLPAVTNTSLLLNSVSGVSVVDSSVNANTPTMVNTVTWNQLSPFATGLGFKNRVYTWTSSGSITF